MILSAVGAQAQPDSVWSHTYGGSGHDGCLAVKQTSDGGYAMAGLSNSFGTGDYDFWLVKTDSVGDSLWSRVYGGSEHDGCLALEHTADGGYVLAGYTDSYGAGDRDMWLLKVDANGDSLWSRTFGGSAYDYCWTMIQTSDGGFALAGETDCWGAGDKDIRLVKTDANGDSLWSHTYGGSGYEGCFDVQQTSDGGYILAGYTPSFGAGGRDAWLVKTDANGDSLWSRTFGGSGEERAWSVRETADGGYIVAGITASFGSGSNDFWLIRTDPNGNSLWSNTFGGEQLEMCYEIMLPPNGGYVLTGYTQSYGAGSNDIWLLRTDAYGDSVWSRTFGGPERELCYRLLPTSDGGFILGGQTESFGVGEYDFWLVRTEPDTIGVPPDGFDLAAPASGDTVDPLSAEFVWQTPLDRDPDERFIYCLYVSTDSLFTSPDSVCLIPDTVYSSGEIVFSQTYWWQVKAFDRFELSTWSNQIWSFITPEPAPPSAFNLLAPENGALLEPGATSFIWDSSIDPDPGDIVTYTIHFVTEADSISYVIGTDTTVLVNPDTVDVLEPGGNAIWYVTAHSNHPDTTIESNQRFAFTASIAETPAQLPREFRLYQNYPNPFNSETTINYDVPKASVVTLLIYDLLGKEVATLVDEMRPAGSHAVIFDGSQLPSGIYFCRLQAGDFVAAKKMVLLK